MAHKITKTGLYRFEDAHKILNAINVLKRKQYTREEKKAASIYLKLWSSKDIVAALNLP